MTTYNTLNPVPSTDVRDLFDNAQNLDDFSNGSLDFYADRLGVSRQSLQGIRNASQYQILGPYAAGLEFTSYNQVFSYLGEFYAPSAGLTLPYTTDGSGAPEIANFRSVGDATLRSDLEARYKNIFYPETYGAVGDGVTDDTTAFNSLRDALITNGGGYVVLDRSFNIPAGLDWTIGNLTLDGLGIGEIKSSGIPNNAVYLHDTTNITVKGLRITVPRANLRTGGFCLLFAEASNIIVSDLKTDGGTVGVWTVNCENVLVEGCYIDTPKADGIHFGHGSKRCKAIGNTVVNSGDDAFSTTFYTGYTRPTDIVFADNIVRGTLWGAGVAVYSADRAVISGNNISNTALFGIVLTEHLGGGQPTDVTVVGNQIAGACQAEKQPESYWFGTDPGLDPDVTSELHKSAIVVEGTDVSVKNNSVSAVNSLPNGLRRRGLMLNGTARAAITGNTFNDINGDGISTTTSANAQLVMNSNTFESVLGVAIRCTSPLATSLSICNNVGGFGASLSGEPYLVYIQNAGSVLAIVANNSSSGSRGIFTDASSTNTWLSNNVAGKQSWNPYTPIVTSTVGAITAYTASGRWRLNGQTVELQLSITITTNGTGAGVLNATLPPGLPALAGKGYILSGREGAVTGVSVTGEAFSVNLLMRTYNNAYPGGDGAVVTVTGIYEAA